MKAGKSAEVISLAVSASVAIYGAHMLSQPWGAALCVAGVMILLSQFESKVLL